jgi:hypothetical protein
MTLRAQIAFDLSLTTGVNFFTLDDVDKGVLDNTEYVLGGDALIDVTEYLRSVQVDRGRSRTLEKFTAGQANISLDNRTRIFDPTYGPGRTSGRSSRGSNSSSMLTGRNCSPGSWRTGTLTTRLTGSMRSPKCQRRMGSRSSPSRQ